MKRYSLEELRTLIQTKCSGVCEWDYPDGELFASVLWGQLYSTSPADTLIYEQMLAQLKITYKLDADRLSEIFNSIAVTTYEEKDYLLSEYCLRQACKMRESISNRNNLAFLLRRHDQMDDMTKAEIITLLLPGIKENEGFSIVNMSLHFAVRLGTESDWQTAESLMKLLDESIFAIEQWWGNMASEEEPEGYLVIMWLLRHGKLKQSDIGTLEELIEKVEKLYPNAPKWLFDKVKDDNSQDSNNSDVVELED